MNFAAVLRKTGHNRSFIHNLRLAVLLCLNAGFINAAGFLAWGILTTNVTGHAALWAISLTTGKVGALLVVGGWLLLFLIGSFLSSLLIEKIGVHKTWSYTIPILIIISCIVSVALAAEQLSGQEAYNKYWAGILLLAMGMQNGLVSIVSGNVVRTSHLTGMFTDLGIDIAQRITHNDKTPETNKKIILRLAIIVSFLSGGIAGSLAFMHLSFKAFYIPVAILFIALFYDYFRVNVLLLYRRHKQH